MANIEQYSNPLQKERTKLSTIWHLNPRRSKPGRELIVCYDQRTPLVNFNPVYSYVVRFHEKFNTAGNHYHKRKQEILIPLEGNFEVHLEDVETGEKEILKLNSVEPTALHIKTGLAHKVVSKEDRGILLVFASSPSDDKDEIEYQVS